MSPSTPLPFNSNIPHHSLALSIKMNILLYLPALLLTLLLTTGLIPTIFYLSLMFLSVLIPSLPFLTTYPSPYVKNAFDLGRQFLYKWTVNWRLVPEEGFLSAPFARALLACHVGLLATFGFTVWCRKQGGAVAVIRRALEQPTRPAALSSVSQDCESCCSFGWVSIAEVVGRRYRDSVLHREFDWYTLCSVAALSVLLVVCNSAPAISMAHQVSHRTSVSLELMERVSLLIYI